ncbi:MAG: energy-coupling factor transporter transmembrane protein EcfT [Clostridiales bacterium]|jgi:energy-coupling factor transport system permease protein|nr:energy-coupling factor transporter transmembrane protein EcfT [Clostridiales bacterium]
MLTNITIGQYYPADSPVHRLDPRFKLVSALAFIILLFFVGNIWGFIFTAVCVFAVIKISRVPPLFLLRGLRGIIFILLFTAVLNVFFTPGDTVLLQFYFLRVTLEGLALAGKMAARLCLLIVGSSLLTLTTSPIELTDAIEYLMKPLKRVGVPAHEIAMMMTIALRFIPTLMEEMDKIMKAQSARGADFDTGGVVKRARALIPLLVPLFISSFRRADELATAMEARCYRGDVNRTRMKELKLSRMDLRAIPFMVLYAAGIFALNFI